LMVDPKRVSVIQCNVTEYVILSERYRGVTVPSCKLKRRGFSGTKGFCS
jgi:predicted nucleic acid-binding Zn ribbon protein